MVAGILLPSCSKDFLKRYDKRIPGTWDLIDVDSKGIGGDTERLPFRNGTFVFSEDGDMTYTDPSGETYEGTWDINKLNGRSNGRGNDVTRIFTLYGVNFTTEEIRSEQFEQMEFTGTNRFRAYIYSGAHVYVFRFKRR